MASDRKRIFKEAKAAAGGSVDKLIEYLKSRPFKVYFDKSGNITYFGQDDVDPINNWKTHAFSQDQLEILKDADTNKYVVVKDKIVDNVYSIQPKTFEMTKRTVTFLEEIISVDDSDVICELSRETISFRFSKNLRRRIGESKPSTPALTFYLTAKNDPHWLFKKFSVPTDKLLTKKISYKLGLDVEISSLSLYTKKVFDTYTLNVL